MGINEVINNYSIDQYLDYVKKGKSNSESIGEFLPISIFEKITNTINTSVNENNSLAEYSYINVVNTNSSDVTINLDPAKNYVVGRPYTIIKKSPDNTLTVNASDNETINGQPSQILTNENETLNIFTDGSNWFKYVYSTSSQGDKNFIFNQSIPSSVWNINHRLNKKPSVAIVDSADSVVHGEISYVDDNNIILTFSGGFSGKAYLN